MTEQRDLSRVELNELYEIMMDDLYDGLVDRIVPEVEECLARGQAPVEVMNRGLVAGMKIVGDDFRDGVLFVPEVLMAAKAMKAGMALLKPLLVETGAEKVGTAVIGTVKGDIHDIGKNLVAMMWEGAGLEVVDLGINTDADSFISALEQNEADVLGMSALLTTTMPYMKVVIDELVKRGLRDRTIVLVGGAPLNEAFAEDIAADAYCQDAAVAVETAKKYLALKREKRDREST
jgi:5-methyltetrahydrofolate--homocysteine methyltransferase